MKIKRLFYYTIFIFVLLLIEAGLLTLSAVIPKEKIQENTITSAEYLCEKEPFFHLSEKDLSSRIDRHADAILLNIAYYYDENAPMRSVIRSSYYYDPLHNENQNVYYAATENPNATYDYMRYWHGSVAFLRPLLSIMPLPQIYGLLALLLMLAFLIAAIVLYKCYGKGALTCFLVSAIMCSLWYVPYSLEYTPTFLLGFISIPLMVYVQNKYPDKIGYLFLFLGSMTAFTDFLTTETITCLLPMTLLITRKKEKPLSLCIRYGFSWLYAYCFTWISKWVLYEMFFGSGASDVLAQTAYRTNGQVATGGLFAQMYYAVLRNLRCLFPFSLIKDPHGRIWVVVFLLFLAMIFWLIRKQKQDHSLIGVYALIGLVPYARYILLSNHSYLHYFFTYRAQFITIFCISLIFLHGTDVEFLKKEWKKRARRKNK